MFKVYLTRRCSDMTEGRGPMVPDACFLHKKDAEEYIDSKPGVMGRTGKWSKNRSGDWDIVPLNVMESLEETSEYIVAQKIEKIKAKLTPEERKLIGLGD